ncbi:MAG: hypothetical protein HQK83_17520, partial [Fibrobacteria bacterium]|nr:hypothetical protein [Fibrobacteria bacterium]
MAKKKTTTENLIALYKGTASQQNKIVSALTDIADMEGEGHGEVKKQAQDFITSLKPKKASGKASKKQPLNEFEKIASKINAKLLKME